MSAGDRSFAFRAGQVLPPDLFITGTLIGHSRLPLPSPPGLKLLLRMAIPSTAGPASDYASVPASHIETACKVTIILTLPPGTSADRLIERDEAQMKGLFQREVSIEASGLEIIRYAKGERMLEAEMQGPGDRMVKLQNGETIHLLRLTPSIDSNTPPWFHSPSPSLDSSTFDRPRGVNLNGLRPITSLPVPDVADLRSNAQAGPSRNGQQSLPSRRIPSPENGLDSAKRRRLDEARGNGGAEQDVFAAPFPKHNGFVNELSRTGSGEFDDRSRQSPTAHAETQDRAAPPSTQAPPASQNHNSRFVQTMQSEQVTTITVAPGRYGYNQENPIVSQSRNRAASSDVFLSKAERSSPAIKDSPVSAGPSRTSHSDQQSTPSRVGPQTTDPSMMAIAEAHRWRKEQLELERLEREAEYMNSDAGEVDLQRPAVIGAVRYLPIDQHRTQTWSNVMGIVVDHPVPPKASFRDHMLSIVIGDPSSHSGGLDREGMVITIFRPRPEQLPQVYKGQAILFRDILFKTWNEKIKGNAFSSDQGHGMNVWAVMSRQGTVKTSTPAMIVSEGERTRMKSLLDWWERLNGGETTTGYIDEGRAFSESPTKRKECDLSVVREGDFCDPTFKILQVQVNAFREPRYEMYITDGTVNPQPTHNWHQTDYGIPASAVWTLAIFGDQHPDLSKHFLVGNYLTMRNVNVKRHRGNGALELKWSDKVTAEQKDMGWKKRTVTPIPHNDHRATEINRKVNILSRAQREGGTVPPPAEDPLPIAQKVEEPTPAPEPSRPTGPVHVPLATHISTIHTDPHRYKLSTIREILQNTVFPNKFRLRARVRSIHARNYHPSGKEDYTTHFCKDCQKPFPSLHICAHCKDHTAQIELRYRLIAMLEAEDEILPIIIADEAAERILPPLPPITTSESEHDKRRKETRIAMANIGVLNVLLGAKMDGVRTRPMIDWTIEVYVLGHDKGDKKKSKEVRVVLARACDMEARG